MARALANPTDFERAFGDDVLVLFDGWCGNVLFDTKPAEWFEGNGPSARSTIAAVATPARSCPSHDPPWTVR